MRDSFNVLHQHLLLHHAASRNTFTILCVFSSELLHFQLELLKVDFLCVYVGDLFKHSPHFRFALFLLRRFGWSGCDWAIFILFFGGSGSSLGLSSPLRVPFFPFFALGTGTRVYLLIR
ncbi:hypothetical protein BDQ12DRAFT_412226 [Crucibulum laeve]|uniref:Uncharacterized protein n=1 Tax=Crucibulum laeve TaxID=68775 RepID=A0A5C3M7R2_9AGAR|nr:hypothetical protein BDQ12DRAFT_412226 [Crucibulum laeve]